MSPKEFLTKCEYEGGFIQGLLYGLRADHLNDDDPKLKELIGEAVVLVQRLSDIETEIIEKYGEDMLEMN